MVGTQQGAVALLQGDDDLVVFSDRPTPTLMPPVARIPEVPSVFGLTTEAGLLSRAPLAVENAVPFYLAVNRRLIRDIEAGALITAGKAFLRQGWITSRPVIPVRLPGWKESGKTP